MQDKKDFVGTFSQDPFLLDYLIIFYSKLIFKQNRLDNIAMTHILPYILFKYDQ